MTKEIICLTDTETTNGLKKPLPYDYSYVLVDWDKNIYEERAFVIADIFLDEKELMKSAYYAEKIPQYWADIKSGKRKLVTLATAQRIAREDFKKYGIKKVFAYNVGFDRRALNNDVKHTTDNKYKYFFPYGTEFHDIWRPACDLLLARPSYVKMALTNNWVSAKGNILTNAECCYRYITKDVNFIEEHKGLEDVLIELEILLYCKRQHKKMDTTPYTACWRAVQKKRAEMGA